MKQIYHKVGENFEYNCVKLRVEEADDCTECFFYKNTSCIPNNLLCLSNYREDCKNVIFKKHTESEIFKKITTTQAIY